MIHRYCVYYEYTGTRDAPASSGHCQFVDATSPDEASTIVERRLAGVDDIKITSVEDLDA